MAYREIADSEVEANAPVTVALLSALRDNLEAVRTNDATAPEINPAALSEQPVGFNSRWQQLSGASPAVRESGVTYVNSLTQPIQVFVNFGHSGSGSSIAQVSHNGTNWVDLTLPVAENQSSGNVHFTVPQGHSYRISSPSANIFIWSELRPV